MVDLQWKSKLMAISQISSLSPPPTPSNNNDNKSPCNPPVPCSHRTQQVDASSAIVDYERYLRLPELFDLCTSRDFPDWKDESILKPSLQALEITFRLISIALSDPRPYSNRREWKRRLESLAAHQIEIIATVICNDEEHGSTAAPIADLSVHEGVLAREKSSQEVWKLNGTTTTLVSHTSEASLLPRLASWDKSEDVASNILLQIECQMRRCPYTLGLGEPNLAGKRSLEYDLIVRPAVVHSLKKSPLQDHHHHHHQVKEQLHEDQAALLTIHQIIESWLCTARQLLRRIGERIDGGELDEAAGNCWLLERIWKLMAEIEDLHLLMDPSDFLLLKSHLGIRAAGSKAFCFRSRALSEVTNLSKDLKHKVPLILGVEVDPNGGPRVQEAAMRLFYSRRRGEGDKSARIQLLQAFQAIEASMKEFFFAYGQVLAVLMGSLEANGFLSDSLTQTFMDPPYFPSLDAAKTFLGERISRQSENHLGPNRSGMKRY